MDNQRPANRQVLRTQNLDKTVPLAGSQRGDGRGLAILSGVSLEINRGESVAIVGASGSGKSTLLGLLAGLDLPSAGEIELFGQALSTLDEDGRAALRAGRVGFVFQDFQLLPELTALENVALPLRFASAGPPWPQARDWLDRVGLAGRREHYPNQLSGGEQQRVAIARAFVTGPELLLADEPTGNLDAQTAAGVIELLFGLNRETNATLVLVTHDPALARRCQRTLCLDGGRLVDA